jgi:hypothetical protein
MRRKSEWEAIGEVEANSLHYWFRQKYNLPITDPRYRRATTDQIRLEYYADMAYRINQMREENPDFNIETEIENQEFSERARNEDGFLEEWCRNMEKELAKNPEFSDDTGNFTTEKMEILNPDSEGTVPLTLKDIENAEKEI